MSISRSSYPSHGIHLAIFNMLYVSLEPQIIRSTDKAITRETRSFPTENYVYLSIILSLARYPTSYFQYVIRLPRATNHSFHGQSNHSRDKKLPYLELCLSLEHLIPRSIYFCVHRSIICLSSDTFQFQFDARSYQAILILP